MENWAEIRRLHRSEGMPIKAIVRQLGVSRNAVRRALAAEGPPKYERQLRGSVVDAAEPRVRELLEKWPTMPATVIAERIGWDRSLTVLKERVAVLRPLYLPPDPLSRTAYVPGELAQCDLWFPPADFPLGSGQAGRPPVLVIVAGYSWVMTAVMLPTRTAPDLIAGHWALLNRLGVVPRALVWDNEPAVGSWRSGRPKLAEEFEAFRGTPAWPGSTQAGRTSMTRSRPRCPTPMCGASHPNPPAASTCLPAGPPRCGSAPSAQRSAGSSRPPSPTPVAGPPDRSPTAHPPAGTTSRTAPTHPAHTSCARPGPAARTPAAAPAPGP